MWEDRDDILVEGRGSGRRVSEIVPMVSLCASMWEEEPVENFGRFNIQVPGGLVSDVVPSTPSDSDSDSTPSLTG